MAKTTGTVIAKRKETKENESDNIMRTLLYTAISAIIIAPQLASSTTLVEGKYQWSFLSGESWPTGYTQFNGKPDNLTWSYPEYNAQFFDRIANALPESRVNEAFLVEDSGANITLKEAGEVFITFLHEGAGYKNSFGYFTFDADNPPTSPSEIDEVIVFPNLSYPHMTSGHRLSIGEFEAGTSIGFFIAANGFSYYTGVDEGNRPHYYSLKDLNPEHTDTLRQHNVLLFDGEFQEVVIGFEDLPRTWGDNDFNDAVFSVKSNPPSAIDSTPLVEIPDANDSDADGIPDTEDEFPDDHDRAFREYFPSAEGWMTLAFEDNWPSIGDYDMNDLVVHQRFERIYNANGEITGFRIIGEIAARGASYSNGFALRIMNVDPEFVESATIEIEGALYDKPVEAGQDDATFILWSDTHKFTDTGQSGSCSHFNTVKSCDQLAPVPFTLDVHLNQIIETLPYASMDFFMFRTDYRGREIHFADYPPTKLFDTSQFGKFADTSDTSTGRFFRNADNLPWALQVPGKWRHPQEYIDILWAYPDYEQWVESSGEQAKDWYSTSDLDSHYY